MQSIARSVRLAAAVAVCAVTAPVFATALPMTLTINAGSASALHNLNPTSVSGGAGIYNGSLSDPGDWNINYNMNASSTVTTSSGVQTGASAYQNGSFAITNISTSEVTYLITLSLPTEVTAPMAGSFTGSISGTLITSGAGLLATAGPGTALWTAQTGGTPIASLFENPFIAQRTTQGATSIGSRNFGNPTPLATPTFGDTIGVSFHFRLSAGATASFTTALSGFGTPVPAPAAITVLACAGLAPSRRRRR
ncbi:MAG: hypothetical protein ACKO3W_13280 [bacterium]